MIKQVLTIEQMKHLAELGVDIRNASMCWINTPEMDAKMLSIHDEFCYEMSCLDPVPAFTLQDIIDILPCDVFGDYNFWLMKAKGGYKFSVKNNPDSAKVGTHFLDSPLEAVYDILCWYMKNKKV